MFYGKFHAAGNSHGDDVILLFEQAHAKLDKGSRIYKLSQDLVELWTQFCNEYVLIWIIVIYTVFIS